ncbi:hypothetical protein QVD17_36770 [Tagetes erecta]|uniref:Uncharacterized protein n=1 Tax=Tagetes erecta TaxID=13708 RepID=A0AAD8NC55_TARER|nr:hypothetical protein QVD17_36770 [Tagetes erecta]
MNEKAGVNEIMNQQAKMKMEDCDYEASKTLFSIYKRRSVKQAAIDKSFIPQGILGTSAFAVPACNKLQRPHPLITLAGNTNEANPLRMTNRSKRRRNNPVISLEVKKQELETELRKLAKESFAANMEHEKSVLTEEERTEFVCLQLALKQETEKTRQEWESVVMERENLKQEKEKLERERKELDEKRAEIKEELESFAIQKENMEKLNRLEQEKLKNMRLEIESYVESELESLKLAKESFAANMEHEKSVCVKEMEKQELETELRNKEMEIENRMREREKTFVEERDRELANLKYLRGVASRELEKSKLERAQLEKEKHHVFPNQKHLESLQLDMKRDIDDLVGLSMKLKDQREQFIKGRERFVSFVGKLKGCTGCGEIVSAFVKREEAIEKGPIKKIKEKDKSLKDEEKKLAEIQNADGFSLTKLVEGYMKKAAQVTSENNIPNVGTSMGFLDTCPRKREYNKRYYVARKARKQLLDAVMNVATQTSPLSTPPTSTQAPPKVSTASTTTLPDIDSATPPPLKMSKRPQRESYLSGYLTCVMKGT